MHVILPIWHLLLLHLPGDRATSSTSTGGKCPKAHSLLDVMLLMSFFPHLVAGPIVVRASDLLPQFAKAPKY